MYVGHEAIENFGPHAVAIKTPAESWLCNDTTKF